MARYYIGSSISENRIWFGIFEKSGDPLTIWSVPTLKRRGCRAVLSEMADEIHKKLAEFRVLSDDAAGIGVSVPAEVGKTGILDYCEELGWGIVNIEALLSGLSGIRVRAGCSRDMAVLGEHWAMGADAPENMVCLLAGNELRGGIIVNNSLILDKDGRSGDLAKILVAAPIDGDDSAKGKVLRETSSFRNMLKRYGDCAEYLGKTASVQNMHVTEACDMVKAALDGDPLCNKILDASASDIALALYNIKRTVCIEKAVIGGEDELGCRIMADKIAGFYGNFARGNDCELKIEPSVLGKKAEVYGSAKYVLISEGNSPDGEDGRREKIC